MGKRGWLLLGFTVVVAILVPQLLGSFWISLVIQILVLGLLALSVDLLLGHTGIFPLGHAAFFAVAAYTTAILQVRYGQPTILAAPAGLGAAVILAIVYGLAVRTSGVYFILVTMALGHIVWGVSITWASFTNGDNGIGNVPFPALGSFSIGNLSSYYYLVLAVVVACALGYHRFTRSPLGLTLRGIRESDSRMRTLGYNVGAHKYAAFVLSGALAGLAGVLYIYFNRFVSPPTASLHVSVEAALMVIVGGTGTVIGPFIGSAIILVLRNYVSAYLVNWMTVMGVVFIATVLWAPDGVLGLMRRWRAQLRMSSARSESRRVGVGEGKDPT